MCTRYYRLARILSLTLFVAGSLLTFPSAIPWMIAGWLALHTFSVVRGWHTSTPLWACMGVVVVKNLYWTPGVTVLVLAVSAVLIMEQFARIRGSRNGSPREATIPKRLHR